VLTEKDYEKGSFGHRFLKLILNDKEFRESEEFNNISLAGNEVIETWIDSIPESYSVYEGFASVEECVESLILPKSKYIFIYFKGQYYAVAYESGTRQIAVGKDKFTYAEDTQLKHDTVHPEYYIRQRARNIGEPKTIYFEMLAIDPNMKSFKFGQEKSKKYYEADSGYDHNFALLGSTFKDFKFTQDNVRLLHFYYNELDVEFFEYYLEYYDFVNINPFNWSGIEYNEKTGTYERTRLPAPFSGYCRRWIDLSN